MTAPASPCPFCEILAGRAPATMRWRWTVTPAGPDYPPLEVAAFVPLAPVTPGHVLVVPFTHVEDAAQDPVVTGVTAQCAALFARDHAGGDFNIITSAGAAATQTVRHLHLHVVPRWPDDGLRLPWSG